MVDTAPAKFVEGRGRGDLEHQITNRAPTRLEGDLAPGTVSSGTTASEKVYVQGAFRARIRGKLTGTAIDSRLRVYAFLADGSSRAGTLLAEEDPVADATEFVLDIDLYGEKWVEIEVEEEGTSNDVDITYIEVSLL